MSTSGMFHAVLGPEILTTPFFMFPALSDCSGCTTPYRWKIQSDVWANGRFQHPWHSQYPRPRDRWSAPWLHTPPLAQLGPSASFWHFDGWYNSIRLGSYPSVHRRIWKAVMHSACVWVSVGHRCELPRCQAPRYVYWKQLTCGMLARWRIPRAATLPSALPSALRSVFSMCRTVQYSGLLRF